MKRALVSPLLAAALVALACGKKGPPSPPAPRGPLPPVSVDVRQTGEDIWVTFTLPDPRGPKPGQAPATAELVRVEFPSEPLPPSDPDAFRRRGQVVGRLDVATSPPRARIAFRDQDWRTHFGGGGWLLRYGVRVRDERGRLSPLVLARDLVPIHAPAPPESVTAEATGEGVRLQWTAARGTADARYNLYRGEAGKPVGEKPIQAQPLAETEYLDGAVETGRTYSYVVRITASDEAPYRESASSSPVSVVAEDRRAPAAPRNLVAVQEGTAVRLFWDPSAERDVAGYRVYRSGADEPWHRIGPEALDRPLYLDGEVGAGQHHVYRVTAIDRAVPPNESEVSEEVPFDVGIEPPEASGSER